jgi:hypothetical protein
LFPRKQHLVVTFYKDSSNRGKDKNKLPFFNNNHLFQPAMPLIQPVRQPNFSLSSNQAFWGFAAFHLKNIWRFDGFFPKNIWGYRENI